MIGVAGGTASATDAPEGGKLRALVSALGDRLRFARDHGLSFGGARDIYKVLGYSRILSFREFRARYARGGIARTIVEAEPKATWRGGIEVYEDENPKVDTQFEKDFKAIDKRLGLIGKMQAADILAGLSTFSILMIGAEGKLETELPVATKGPESLLFLRAYSGGAGIRRDWWSGQQTTALDARAKIKDLVTDSADPRFGEPLTYEVRLAETGQAAVVHWTRVVHMAEGCLEDDVFGQPVLESVWNYLDDLDKVSGGGSEAFWLRANAGLQVDVDKDMEIPRPVAGELSEMDKLRQQAEDYEHQITRMWRTRGTKITQLGSDTADFAGPVDSILKLIAGTRRIPMRILVGSEMGTLASEQDAGNWNTVIQDRRTGYAAGRLRVLVGRLIEYGYLTEPAQWDIDWPVEEDMDEPAKADLAVKLATVNKTNGGLVFTDDFIREKSFDLEPLTAEERKAAADAAEAAAPAQPEPVPGEEPVIDTPAPKPAFGKFPRAASAGDDLAITLEAMEAAILAGDMDSLAALAGMDKE